ncbi:hypothetical protein BDAP_000757 [Binucleata daphniae]
MDKLLTDIKVKIKTLQRQQKIIKMKCKTDRNISNEMEIDKLNDILYNIKRIMNSTETNDNVKYYKEIMFDELLEIETECICSKKLERIINDFEVRKYGYEGGEIDDWSGESCEMKRLAKQN